MVEKKGYDLGRDSKGWGEYNEWDLWGMEYI